MTTISGINCPVCATSPSSSTHSAGTVGINCPRCGNFKLTDVAAQTVRGLNLRQRGIISGWLRENPGVTVSEKHLEELSRLRMPSIGERAEKVLHRLAEELPNPGTFFSTSSPLAHELGAVGRTAEMRELEYLLYDYLTEERQLLSYSKYGFKISPKGWVYLDSLRQGNPNSQIVFIAMWFDKTMNSAWLALDKAIRGASYDPLRIDNKEHNNKIDDEIIAGIRRSKFLVADLTGHRSGVYFEAGFALGLGLPVIWSCREDEMEKRHFDTHQYNFIVWTEDKLPDLSKALQNRIEATIGKGSLAAANP